MFSSSDSALKTRAKLTPVWPCSTMTLPSRHARSIRRRMLIVAPAKRKKQIVSPNNCATSTRTTPAADGGARQTNPRRDSCERRLIWLVCWPFSFQFQDRRKWGFSLFKLVGVLCVVTFDLLIGYALGKAH